MKMFARELRMSKRHGANFKNECKIILAQDREGSELKQAQHSMRVTYYHRKPHESYFSMERLFATLREKMPPNIVCTVAVSPFVSQGLWRRIINIVKAPLVQGDINHITGDEHYLAILLHKKKTVLTIHDCAGLDRFRGVKRSVFLLFWFWLPEKRSSVVTTISHSTKDELVRHLRCSPDKIRVIHDCVSDAFKPCPKPFNAKRPVILQVGTMKNKNLNRVVEALRGISCHLRIIGKLDEHQVSALSVHNIDHSAVANISDDEIIREYERSDMLVFVSTYEGFGLPIIEANAVGRPVITSNILSMPEVAGKAACLVDPFSVQAIKDGILRIISDESYRRQLVVDGFVNVERFAPATIAGQYAGIYEDVYLAAKRGTGLRT